MKSCLLLCVNVNVRNLIGFQDGMLIQEQSIHSLDLSDVALEDENQKHAKNEENSEDAASSIPEVDDKAIEKKDSEEVVNQTSIIKKRADKKPFEKFLDIMEIF